jgi:hypothetical protein
VTAIRRPRDDHVTTTRHARSLARASGRFRVTRIRRDLRRRVSTNHLRRLLLEKRTICAAHSTTPRKRTPNHDECEAQTARLSSRQATSRPRILRAANGLIACQ